MTLLRPVHAADGTGGGSTPGALLERAVGWRCGTAVSVDRVPRTPADPPIVQYSARYGPADDRTPAGGAATNTDQARSAAVGELLERYAAASFPLPLRSSASVPPEEQLGHDDFTLHSAQQRAHPGFPHHDSYASDRLTQVFRLRDNTPMWVPANLVSNDPSLGHLATSNGLAAAPTSMLALLRATQELIERDALVTTWLHGVPARQVPVPPQTLAALGGGDGFALTALDLTPAFSPHPVAAVFGSAPLAGRDRHSIGLACRSTFTDAATKAALEWAQGVSFAGVNSPTAPPPPEPEDVTSFDEHAVFYTRRPDLWHALPVWDGPVAGATPGTGTVAVSDQLAELVTALDGAGVDLFYRDLTLPDLAGCGVRAVRVLSPQLVPIHPDHRWPHLGGTCADLAMRYPWARSTGWPAALPHPLG
ncbi:YcaO-like family protein [Ruania alba]|uniref:Ribosomal protein S12 methylthiotransferase accessory factor n=1 Tax=Ruania alba TaxID=648782 RepID=A0A1H5MM47_9MICO|nr:YcaO-like family protein [Ruania alba]SEE89807.1 ribosomal protein S12 methylthiotransferase accessory factor [Ruania alba]